MASRPRPHHLCHSRPDTGLRSIGLDDGIAELRGVPREAGSPGSHCPTHCPAHGRGEKPLRRPWVWVDLLGSRILLWTSDCGQKGATH